jgi:hypothetical protein
MFATGKHLRMWVAPDTGNEGSGNEGNGTEPLTYRTTVGP